MSMWSIYMITTIYFRGEGGRPACPLLAMLWGYLMQTWFHFSGLSLERMRLPTTRLEKSIRTASESFPGRSYNHAQPLRR